MLQNREEERLSVWLVLKQGYGPGDSLKMASNQQDSSLQSTKD